MTIVRPVIALRLCNCSGHHWVDFPHDSFDEFGRVSEVTLDLDVEPESGRLTEVASEPKGRVERDGPASVDDFVDSARRDSDGSGERVLREAHRRHVIFEEDFSRCHVVEFGAHGFCVVNGNRRFRLRGRRFPPSGRRCAIVG